MMRINKQITCYLTPAALQVINHMVDRGMDEDLAITLLETVWPENAIYEIPSLMPEEYTEEL